MKKGLEARRRSQRCRKGSVPVVPMLESIPSPLKELLESELERFRRRDTIFLAWMIVNDAPFSSLDVKENYPPQHLGWTLGGRMFLMM